MLCLKTRTSNTIIPICIIYRIRNIRIRIFGMICTAGLRFIFTTINADFIIITTKRGKEGKPKVTYSGSATVQTMATKYEMLDAQDFMIQSNRWFKEKWMYDNKVGIYGGKNESEAFTRFLSICPVDGI